MKLNDHFQGFRSAIKDGIAIVLCSERPSAVSLLPVRITQVLRDLGNVKKVKCLDHRMVYHAIEPTTSTNETRPSQEEAFKGISCQCRCHKLGGDSHTPELRGNRIHTVPFIEIQAGKPVFVLSRTPIAPPQASKLSNALRERTHPGPTSSLELEAPEDVMLHSQDS